MRLGPDVLQVSEIKRLLQVCGMLIDPLTYFLRAPHIALPRLLPPLRVRTTSDGPWVAWHLSLPDDIEPCRSMFVLIAGSARVSTRLVGLGNAQVEYDADGHTAVIRILPPTSNTVWTRLRRGWFAARNVLTAYDELMRQQESLRAAIRARDVALWQREQALQEKDRALRVRDQFLQNMGHELRTPVNGIINTIGDLRESDGPDRESLLDAAHLSAARLSAVLETTLSYAKVTSESIVCTPTPSRPADLLRIVAGRLRPLAAAVGVRLEVEVGPDGGRWWALDERHVGRSIEELVRNAIEASPDDGLVELFCSVTTEHRLTIEVRDRGPGYGLDRSYHDHRDDAWSVRDLVSKGLGLGLQVAWAKVGAMNGDIALSDRPGGGTVARIAIPVRPAAAPTGPRAQSRRVLVVDDDRINRMVVRRLLLKMGCEVSEAVDGADAIAKLRGDRFDLVLMDCDMPVVDGWECTVKIRRELSLEIPVVAVTATASEADRTRCFEVGMNDFMAKPIDRARLEVTVDKWLGPRPSRADAVSPAGRATV